MTSNNGGTVSLNVNSGTCVTGATNSMTKHFKSVMSLYNEDTPFLDVDSVHTDWNVAAVMSGDGNERFTLNTCYSSSNLDGALLHFGVLVGVPCRNGGNRRWTVHSSRGHIERLPEERCMTRGMENLLPGFVFSWEDIQRRFV